MKKLMTIFMRDLRVNTREFLTLFLILMPIIFALCINAFAPGINDTTVNLALVEGDSPEQAAYYGQFARVELYKDLDAVVERVKRRDNIVAIVPDGDAYYIMTQGNEPKQVVEYASLLKTFYETDRQIENTSAEILEFGVKVPPLKQLLANLGIIMVSIMAGMLISLNIVEEKMDNTVSAVNITPVSRTAFIFGKSVIGAMVSIVGAITMVLILGFWNINFAQLLGMAASATFLTLMIGFIQGINNEDIMSAAASVKMLFLPLAASIAAYEFLADKWQPFFYWSPFYWLYKGNEAIFSNSASWKQILSYAGIILLISGLVYAYLAPKIRRGLEH